MFKSVIKDVKGGFKDDIHPDLVNLYRENYQRSLAMFGNPKPGDQFYELYERFLLNEVRIATYKAYHVTKALKGLPADGFDKQALMTLKKFNRYQITEYNTMVARARTAKQFEQFKEDSDLYPCLEWLPTRSAAPRDEHAELVGLILPINDPFWNENQPGNLWNCKCDWRQVDKPANRKGKSVTPATGLEGNPAETGELITDKHPYVANVRNNKPIEKLTFLTYLKPLIDSYRKSIPSENIIVSSPNLVTGEIQITPRSVREVVRHNELSAVKQTAMLLDVDCSKWKYMGWAYPEKGKHPEAAYFLYYSTTISNVKKYVNVIVHKSFGKEVPYAICNTIKQKLKKGKPKDLDIWIK